MQQTSPKDVFLQLFSIAGLYAAAGSLVALLFEYVNVLVPDPLAYYGPEGSYSSIRWALASLVIVFPLYIGSIWFLERNYAVNPAAREIKTRKWLVYFTLFLAALIMAGDFVALVYALLNGDLTLRFALKALAVLLIVGTIFAQYLAAMREGGRSKAMRICAWGAIGAVLIAIVYGFFLVGSPQEERLRQFDLRRTNDLQTIQSEIVNYRMVKGRLPASLHDLKDDIRGFVPPADPVTSVPYRYTVKGPLSFELCATFERASDASAPQVAKPAYPRGNAIEENWSHGAGETCFSRTIDPERYPIIQKPPL